MMRRVVPNRDDRPASCAAREPIRPRGRDCKAYVLNTGRHWGDGDWSGKRSRKSVSRNPRLRGGGGRLVARPMSLVSRQASSPVQSAVLSVESSVGSPQWSPTKIGSDGGAFRKTEVQPVVRCLLPMTEGSSAKGTSLAPTVRDMHASEQSTLPRAVPGTGQGHCTGGADAQWGG